MKPVLLAQTRNRGEESANREFITSVKKVPDKKGSLPPLPSVPLSRPAADLVPEEANRDKDEREGFLIEKKRKMQETHGHST